MNIQKEKVNNTEGKSAKQKGIKKRKWETDVLYGWIHKINKNGRQKNKSTRK